MSDAIAFLSFLLVPSLYVFGVREAVRRRDEVMLLVVLIGMAVSARIGLWMSGVPALPLF